MLDCGGVNIAHLLAAHSTRPTGGATVLEKKPVPPTNKYNHPKFSTSLGTLVPGVPCFCPNNKYKQNPPKMPICEPGGTHNWGVLGHHLQTCGQLFPVFIPCILYGIEVDELGNPDEFF